MDNLNSFFKIVVSSVPEDTVWDDEILVVASSTQMIYGVSSVPEDTVQKDVVAWEEIGIP